MSNKEEKTLKDEDIQVDPSKPKAIKDQDKADPSDKADPKTANDSDIKDKKSDSNISDMADPK